MAHNAKDNRLGIWLAATGGVGFVLILFLTRQWGVGVLAESMAYVEAARHFVSGLGFSIFSGAGTVTPLVTNPPGFPFVLSWGWFLGMDAFHWARILNAFFFGINIVLAGLLAWSWSRNKIAGLVAAGLFLCSPQLLEIHLHLLAEPILFAAVLTALIALQRHEEQGGRGTFYLAVGATLVAGMIRPVETALVLTAWAVLFSIPRDGVREKTLKTWLFALLAFSFSVIWYIRNVFIGNMAWGIYPSSDEKVYTFLDTFSMWFLPSIVFDAVRWAVLGLVVGTAAALWWKRKEVKIPEAASARGVEAGILFMVAYLASCLCLMGFLSPAPGISNAIFSPVLVVFLVVLACGVVRVDLKKIFVVAIAVFFAISLARSVKLAIAFEKEGHGYSSRTWTDSKVLRELRALDERVRVYTNSPEAMYYLTGRPSVKIASRQEREVLLATPEALKMFADRQAVGVVFNGERFAAGSQWQDLKDRAALQKVMSDDVAAIYIRKKTSGAVQGEAFQK